MSYIIRSSLVVAIVLASPFLTTKESWKSQVYSWFYRSVLRLTKVYLSLYTKKFRIWHLQTIYVTEYQFLKHLHNFQFSYLLPQKKDTSKSIFNLYPETKAIKKINHYLCSQIKTKNNSTLSVPKNKTKNRRKKKVEKDTVLQCRSSKNKNDGLKANHCYKCRNRDHHCSPTSRTNSSVCPSISF